MSKNITILFGENSFGRKKRLKEMENSAKAEGYLIEKIDSEDLDLNKFLDLISGISLLAEKRFIVINKLSDNSSLWSSLADLVMRNSENKIVILEEKLDKRTKHYKELSKVVNLEEFKNLEVRDSSEMAEKIRLILKQKNISADLKTANFLIDWVGLDEQRIYSALERLVLMNDFSESSIKEFIPQNITENSFTVFELALKGRISDVLATINNLKISEGLDGGYQFFGLISSQFFNLYALKIGQNSAKTTAEIAKSLGINAWALGKMEQFTSKLNMHQLEEILRDFVNADDLIKNSNVNVWEAAESVLIKIAIK